MNEEEKILNRLRRRLKSARATVMLEFAFVAPFVIILGVFAADFTRILRTEQQLEIANRLAADVEAHMADFHTRSEDGEDAKTPCKTTKRVAKFYLSDVANVVEDYKKVYMKGGCGVIKNPVSVAIDAIAGFLGGDSAYNDGSLFLKILGKIFSGILNFVTFRTVKYLTEVVPHDREVWVTTAAYIPTILPYGSYELLGLPESYKDDGIGVWQYTPDLEGDAAATAWDLSLKPFKRHRVYCYMPVIDSAPLAPETYVRKFKAWCAKQSWAKGLLD